MKDAMSDAGVRSARLYTSSSRFESVHAAAGSCGQSTAYMTIDDDEKAESVPDGPTDHSTTSYGPAVRVSQVRRILTVTSHSRFRRYHKLRVKSRVAGTREESPVGSADPGEDPRASPPDVWRSPPVVRWTRRLPRQHCRRRCRRSSCLC
jgi:hypothetical protein